MNKLFLYFLLLSSNFYAQKIEFIPIFNQKHIELHQSINISNGLDSIRFEKLKFYVSNLKLILANGDTIHLEQQHHLINLENPKSLNIDYSHAYTTDSIEIELITFHLGIDSTTNVSGAYGGDLDPTTGMYWSWQSGYINFKLEGLTSLLKGDDNHFQYHLGGYTTPHNCLTSVSLVNIHPQENLTVYLDLYSFFQEIEVGNSTVMSPSKLSVNLSRKLAECFKMKE